ncbi:MAG: UDP-GlcNAc:undecaprenyl-phosphate/decaprenyl-phosphate GlcNAc-phosphate transferase [Halanaerobiales bacterium]|nr:UDP-GlcNAc:undecaprenyl-phosphate/decaprenyl-phosphate GlcNAc-phosphate transferase [Halanaerobiales bacterium]
MQAYISAFFASLIITYLSTPLIRKTALAIGAVDKPGARRINTRPVPTIGGVAIYIGFLTAVLLATSFNRVLTGIILGGTFILLVGILDDLYELSPRMKLCGQIIAACILILFGIKVEFITNPFGGMIYLGYWGIPLTILWTVGITNTLNLVDGLDGLAAGVSAIAALTLFFVGLQEGQVIAAIIAIALAGSSLGFLKFNFNPAEIFMGDTGAMFSGFILAAVSVAGALKSAAAVTLVVPFLALGFPIFDTIFAIVRRLYNGKPIGEADHGHIHHRLLALGMNQRQAVLSVYGISLGLGLMALIINGSRLQEALVLLTLVIVGLIFGAWKLGIFTVELPSEGATLEKSNV